MRAQELHVVEPTAGDPDGDGSAEWPVLAPVTQRGAELGRAPAPLS